MNRRQRNRRKYLTYSAGGVVASEAHVGFNRRPVGRWWPRSHRSERHSRFLDKVRLTRRSNGGGNSAPGLGNDCWLGRRSDRCMGKHCSCVTRRLMLSLRPKIADGWACAVSGNGYQGPAAWLLSWHRQRARAKMCQIDYQVRRQRGTVAACEI